MKEQWLKLTISRAKLCKFFTDIIEIKGYSRSSSLTPYTFTFPSHKGKHFKVSLTKKGNINLAKTPYKFEENIR